MATPRKNDKVRTELPPPQQQAELNPTHYRRNCRTRIRHRISTTKKASSIRPVVESEVQLVARYMRYELSRVVDGYRLTRDRHTSARLLLPARSSTSPIS